MMTPRSVRRWLVAVSKATRRVSEGIFTLDQPTPSLTLRVTVACAAVALTSLSAIAQTTKAPVKKTTPSGVQPVSGTSQPKSANNPGTASGGAATQPRQRPAAETLRIPEPSPEVLEILRDWEANTKKYHRLQGEFRKFKYDSTYLIETRAIGEFYYEVPDKGAYQLKGDPDPKIAKGLINKKPVNGREEEFKVEAAQAERWICTGKEILQINDSRKEYVATFVPKEYQGEDIMRGPLPFLLGMKADIAKRRWEFRLLKRTEAEIWLSARPLQQTDAAEYRMATIILDPKRFLPTAVRLFHSDGNTETVHLFANVKENKSATNWLGQSPLEPRLKGYKMAQNPEAPATGSTGNKTAPGAASGGNATTPQKSTATKPGSKTATK
jgi:TIGR03009 family protein